ncbi:hypothetical protein K504DRAFT_505933 [Pleomassaria siparia CBS 279.74]|uniref:Uncharacterized protein n=1 Tax=Pleomassaria siparia CBS 279.74 TaxID=1314801 RepID=A0A6G1JZ36_9PLEO|nr:hypothetical protein K504DRAFT_505933 [Pleomassaria siparia CBS 279.74]
MKLTPILIKVPATEGGKATHTYIPSSGLPVLLPQPPSTYAGFGLHQGSRSSAKASFQCPDAVRLLGLIADKPIMLLPRAGSYGGLAGGHYGSRYIYLPQPSRFLHSRYALVEVRPHYITIPVRLANTFKASALETPLASLSLHSSDISCMASRTTQHVPYAHLSPKSEPDNPSIITTSPHLRREHTGYIARRIVPAAHLFRLS